MLMAFVMGLYSLGLALGLTLAAPWWLTRMLTTERYRDGLGQRLGGVPAALLHALSFAGGQRRVVWVHAVSVGEVLAASRLVEELKMALLLETGNDWLVVISTTTRTGQALARERFGAERVFYFPLDFGWIVRRYLEALRPSALVLMESELWPRMLYECGRRGVPVVVANARVSDRSFQRGMRVAWVWQWVLGWVTMWLTQTHEDAQRLLMMGAPEDRVKIAGNLKYDVRAPRESRVAELIKEAAAGRPIVVAGSTVGGNRDAGEDEERWFDVFWGSLLPEANGALLVVAPRHPERFDRVAEICSEYATIRATELLVGDRGTHFSYSRDDDDQRPEIVLLDTIGDLAAVYAVADIAFVGGSMIKRGGHNPLEPAQFGVPVVMGPSYENFRDVVERLVAVDGIAIVGRNAGLSAASAKSADFGRDDKFEEGREKASNGGLQDDLAVKLRELLSDRDAARAMGERGRRVFEEQQGATRRVVEAVVALVQA